MEKVVIGGIGIEATSLGESDPELTVGISHVLTDGSLHEQHGGILDGLQEQGVKLSYAQSAAVFNLLYKVQQLHDEIEDFGASVIVTFTFVRESNHER